MLVLVGCPTDWGVPLTGIWWAILTKPPTSKIRYLSRLRRDSVGADFQSVRKLTNYVCAKPPESRLSAFRNTYKHSGDISVAEVTDIEITQH